MKKFFAIFFAFLAVMLTVKPGIAFHFCGGNLAQAKPVLGHGLATCGMEKGASECENHAASAFHKTPCCQDEVTVLSTDNFHSFNKTLLPEISYSAFVFGSGLFFTNTSLFRQDSGFWSYRPPPGQASVYLPFIRVFRI